MISLQNMDSLSRYENNDITHEHMDDIYRNIENPWGCYDTFEEIEKLVTSKTLAEYFNTAVSVLDAGCGAGHYLSALRKYYPDLKLTGLDISISVVNKATELSEKNSNGRIDFLYWDLSEPFPKSSNNKYDVVLAVDFLQYARLSSIAVWNLYESLSSHGILIVGDDRKNSYYRNIFGKKFDMTLEKQFINKGVGKLLPGKQKRETMKFSVYRKI